MKAFFELAWLVLTGWREFAAEEREIEAECEEVREREGADGAATARLGRTEAAA